jgi:hypothetical protein
MIVALVLQQPSLVFLQEQIVLKELFLVMESEQETYVL